MQKSNDLRQRMKRLADRFSQAELARRTGVSKANVHRYLRAGRVPADFLQALVREFHVRPDWLLEGRGAMLRSEVTEHAAQESAKLLELVVNLNAISHERLGALSEQGARQVRALADAVTRHDELRSRLNQRVTPAFEQLVRRQQQHLNAAELEQADDLATSLEQLARLCDDQNLRVRHDMLEAVRLWWKGDLERQGALHRRVLGRLIAAGNIRQRQFLRITYNYCAGLHVAGRLEEAARVADAVAMLACPVDPEWDEDLLITVPRAVLHAARGDIGDGLRVLTRVDATVSTDLLPFTRNVLLGLEHQAGHKDLAALLPQWQRGSEASLLLIALWEDTPRALSEALAACDPGQPPVTAAFVDAARAIKGGEMPPPLDEASLRGAERAVLRTEAARREGRKDVHRLWKEAAGRLASLPGVLPPMPLAALHQRQALELGAGKVGEDSVKSAREKFQKWLSQGNGCVRKLCDTNGIRAVVGVSDTRPQAGIVA